MKKLIVFQAEVKIPENIHIEKKNHFLIFSGPLGQGRMNLIKLDQKGIASIQIIEQKKVIRIKSSSQSFFNSLHNLIKNKIRGVSQGYLVYLRIIGIGYRAILKDQTLSMKLGFSHDVKYNIPPSVRIFLIEPTLICLFGIDKNQVTQIAAKIRQIKPPSPYKGKGIMLGNEKIILKQGKQK